ncbi:unannotated protein [freshwater metagenome]|uniref:Unannotated protein n=1 Tax=freshwater metagenome TaxID=449393 RepID=A0A6J5YTC9_9ZZZZ|nr:hypothetical protein [Actinomycetota bacterium]
MHKRLIPLLALFCALALIGSGAASARILDVGAFDTSVKPGCPGTPCYAISRTTGYQSRSGSNKAPMVVSHNGRIVAWTIALGKPTTKQIAFFDSKLGGEATAQLTILSVTKKTKKTPKAKNGAVVSRQGESVKLKPYFGRTVQIALQRSIWVKKGQIIALTVPTWAPALATGLDSSTAWNASRGKGQCEDTQGQTSQLAVKQFSDYYCKYTTARITYSAQIVPDA